MDATLDEKPVAPVTRFKSLPLGEIAARLEGVHLDGDPALVIVGLAGLEEAVPGQLSFLSNPRYAPLLAGTRASAVIVPREAERPENGAALLRTDTPYLAFARTLRLLARERRPESGVHEGAHVHPAARVGAGAAVLPGAYLGPGSEIGAGTVLFPGAVVMGDVRIGAECLLYSGVVVREDCVVGDRVILHPNVNIGGDGYGFAQHEGRHEKVPQLGRVEIGDDVEIGAGSCVDRGTLGATVIGRGSKIDDLVMIAHGSRVGRDAIIVAQSGMAGSAVLEDGVTLGARAGVLGHLTVGEGAVVYSRAHVTKDVPPGARVSGNPARPHAGQLKQDAVARRMDRLLDRVAALEAEVARLKGEGRD